MIMFIRKRKYNSLVDKINELTNKCKTLQADKDTCQDTIKQLTEEINQQISDCKIGPWCKTCQHCRVVYIESMVKYETNWFSNQWMMLRSPEQIQYCGKHTHEICPEWEPQK